ncbi:MAG: CHRD domain-containing protein [Solirubrobacterales bacterium]
MRINPNSKLVVAALAIAVTAMAVPALSLGAKTKKVFVEAKLKGQNEVPGPGDPNGRGTFDAKLKTKKNKKNGKVCFDLAWRKLDGASAAHIHKGDEETAGPIKVGLFGTDPELPGEDRVEECVKAKKKLLRKIGKRPENFYVNVHNSAYPDGAIRGQLELVE